ncbi:MAG TPA: DUF6789 family protein [Candidatus Sulfotelmatobacter sp.]|nr:DUF6789 family protein [Candidatus Sulfotelmatobacter sp.]
MNQNLQSLRDGALAGLLATGAMSLVMLLGQRVLHRGKHPPQHIVEATLHLTSGQTPKAEHARLLALLAHFAFGATAGALFSWTRLRVARPLSPVGLGALYGLAVWAASYKGWIPALGILPPPEQDRPGRARTMIAAHLAYGSVLGAVAGKQQG